MRYLLMCCFAEDRWEKIPEPERDAIMQEYGAWIQGIERSGHHVATAKLRPSSTATTIRAKDGKPVITDGPFVETKEQLGGYHLIECKGVDEAIAIAGHIPTLRVGGTIEVRPVEPTAPISRKRLWVGRIMSALPVLMLLFSGILKLIKPAPVVEEFARLGYPESLVLGIGLLELACAFVYVIPRTSILGAIVLTGYLGGATATHVRIGDPFLSPIVVGVLVWGGLFLRDDRLRALLPWRSSA